MTRIAVCFYGLIGSKIGKNGEGEDLDPGLTYEYLRKHVFDVNDDVDVFIHSTSIEYRKELCALYNPKSFLIEEQRTHYESRTHRDVRETILDRIIRLILLAFGFRGRHKMRKSAVKAAERAYSRWYSVKKSVGLMQDYALKNNINYDYVLITRLDVAFFTDLVFSELDKDKLYVSHWNDPEWPDKGLVANKSNHHKGEGFLDFWFILNQKNAERFGLLYDKINNYDINPHFASFQHSRYLGLTVRYILFRWFDHEMVRRIFFRSKI